MVYVPIAWWLEHPEAYGAQEMAAWYWRLIRDLLAPAEPNTLPLSA
ncbi:MAG: hypothetical protein JNL73_11025 [Anaerolineales bacterium]|nr:hypothetical protein [Anaerolineales bacterium]